MENNEQILKLLKKIKRAPNKSAANTLVKIYYREMLGYVFNRTRDKEVAMDITQEIFVDMLRSIPRFDEKKSSLRTWLYRIASRRIADYYRGSEFRKLQLTDFEELSSMQKLEVPFATKVEINEINDFVAGLDDSRREIFQVKIFSDLTFEQIAEITEMPVASVKTKFYATQKLIKKEFGEHD